MATYVYVPFQSIIVPTSSDTVRLRFFLPDGTDPTVGASGIVYGNVTVTVSTPGTTSGTVFPSFSTSNWAAVTSMTGWYDLIVRGATPGELALLTTPGGLTVEVAATGTKGAHIAAVIVTADAVRTDGEAFLWMKAALAGNMSYDNATGVFTLYSDAGHAIENKLGLLQEQVISGGKTRYIYTVAPSTSPSVSPSSSPSAS